MHIKREEITTNMYKKKLRISFTMIFGIKTHNMLMLSDANIIIHDTPKNH